MTQKEKLVGLLEDMDILGAPNDWCYGVAE